MKAGVVAICVNLLFNYLLIYGVFFFPRLGVRGAAIATVLSRYVEAAIVIGWTHRHTEKNAFANGLYSTLKVPANLTKKILVKGTPLLFNETLWASAMAMLTQCYSIRGLNVVASLNISRTQKLPHNNRNRISQRNKHNIKHIVDGIGNIQRSDHIQPSNRITLCQHRHGRSP